MINNLPESLLHLEQLNLGNYRIVALKTSANKWTRIGVYRLLLLTNQQ